MTASCLRAFFLAVFCACSSLVVARQVRPHVVLIVWDGMRPDFATARYAPVLDQLARSGIRFQNHHSVFLTATDVNGAALATGAYPDRNGIFANLAFHLAINRHRSVDSGDPETIQAGDAVSGGKYLALPTISELAREAGRKVALAGSKGVAVLFDRHNEWSIQRSSDKQVPIFVAAPMPDALQKQTVDLLGSFLTHPGDTATQRNNYTTHALTDILWRDGVADFSLLWLSEPDLSQHDHSPGSPQAVAAIKAVDANLATVLDALEQKHARDSTDIFVVSDHGFSTIRRSIDPVPLLNQAGFHAVTQFRDAPQPGDILVCGNGGSVLFYVKEHDRTTIERLVDWLNQSDFAGIIFADYAEGAFPLAKAYLDVADPPDVMMSFRYSDEKNRFGVAGMIDADWNRKPGEGTHVTLSSWDVHNMLIAAGPDLRHGFVDNLPSGNVDLAPTILHLLGIPLTPRSQGRELAEAFLENQTSSQSRQQRTDRTSRVTPKKHRTQSLQISSVSEHEYIDSGAVEDCKDPAEKAQLQQSDSQ